jgi:hypothetical protein
MNLSSSSRGLSGYGIRDSMKDAEFFTTQASLCADGAIFLKNKRKSRELAAWGLLILLACSKTTPSIRSLPFGAWRIK